MGAALDNLALIHDQDQVGFLDGCQAVSDHQGSTTLHDVVEGCLDMTLRLGIQRRGGLIEDQQRRVFEQRPGNRQTLALTAGKQHAVLADLSVQALR